MANPKKVVVQSEEIVTPITLSIQNLMEVLSESIDLLYKYDSYLLVKNLSERSITHMLATHISSLISKTQLNVDCEYNGDIMNEGLRKKIKVLTEKLNQIRP